MYEVYGMSASGNCHKVRMVLEALNLPYQWHDIDPAKGEARTPAYLAMNRNGKVPVMRTPEGAYLPESNAIMFYLADGTALMPGERLERARVMQWLFFEQYSHEPFIAVARFLRRFHPDPESQRALAASKLDGGNAALAVMEEQLTRTPYLAGQRFSIADIGLYAYTHVAHEGGFDLARFPAVVSWLKRVTAQHGCAPMA